MNFPEHEFVPSIKNKLMFTHFLNILATVISVVSLLIVTYGALVAFISFLGNELKAIYRTIFNSQYPSAASGIRYLFIIGIGVADRFRYS